MTLSIAPLTHFPPLNSAAISSPPQVVGQPGNTGIPSSTGCSFRIGLARRPAPPDTVSFADGSGL